jgi:hypothetical protein
MVMRRATTMLVGSVVLMVICVAPSRADFDILNGEIVTTTQNLGDNETGIVEQGGEIDITSVDEFAIEAGTGNYITNHGLISVSSGQGKGTIRLTGGSNTITNTGTIEIENGSGTNSNIYIVGVSITMINSGSA